MGGVRLGGIAAIETGSLPYVILELGTPDPPGWYYNIWRVLNGVPTRLTEFTFNTGRQPELDNPRLSPDGDWIACGVNFWDATPFGSGLIAVPSETVTADGDEIMVYSDNGDGDWLLHPNWHPDSDLIIFTHGPLSLLPEGGFAGSVCQASLSNPGDPLTELWTPQMLAVPQREGAFRPTWSPDGTKIAFIVNIESGGGGWDFSRAGLWVMDADGSNDQLIRPWVDGSNNQVYQFRGSQIAWSPDSEWIAFRPAGFGASEDFSLYKIRPDGTDELLLMEGHPLETSVGWQIDNTAWADDLDYLIATVNGGIYGSGWSIYRVEADGSGATELLDGLDSNSPAGSDYFRQVYRNHLTGRLEWIRARTPAGIVTSSAIDLTDIVDLQNITDDDPANPGNPVGDLFYSGTGHDWL